MKCFLVENNLDETRLSDRYPRTFTKIARLISKVQVSNFLQSIKTNIQNNCLVQFTQQLVLRFHGMASINEKKALRLKTNVRKHAEWNKNLRNWPLQNWKTIFSSTKTRFNSFLTACRVYVRRQPKQLFYKSCLLPIAKLGRRSVIIWVEGYILKICRYKDFPSCQN